MDLQDAELPMLTDIALTPPGLEHPHRLGEIGIPELVEPPLLRRPLENLLRRARAGAVDPVVVPPPAAIAPEAPRAGGPALRHVLVPVLPSNLGIGRDPEPVGGAGRGAGCAARDGRQLHLVHLDRRLRPPVGVLDDHARDALSRGPEVAQRDVVVLPLPGDGIAAEVREAARPAEGLIAISGHVDLELLTGPAAHNCELQGSAARCPHGGVGVEKQPGPAAVDLPAYRKGAPGAAGLPEVHVAAPGPVLPSVRETFAVDHVICCDGAG